MDEAVQAFCAKISIESRDIAEIFRAEQRLCKLLYLRRGIQPAEAFQEAGS